MELISIEKMPQSVLNDIKRDQPGQPETTSMFIVKFLLNGKEEIVDIMSYSDGKVIGHTDY